jgi:hypothetical protein
MRAMRRSHFIILGNIVWFALFAAEIAAVLAPDYMAWWQREGVRLRRSCDEDTFRFDLLDRVYLFGSLWLFSAPAMSLAALRIPEHWPERLPRFWWNRSAPGLSAATAVAAFVLVLWPLASMANAPVTSMLLIEAARALLLLGAVLYYRAVLLNSPLGGGDG